MSMEKYYQSFPKGEIRKEALRVALETRRFEIDLYWKRATYFWTFISIAFAAYGYVQQKDADAAKAALSFMLSCVGFVLSFSWWLANRGSKQWQENWEHHVDHLEDDVIGPLFKTTLPRDKPKGARQRLNHFFFGPSRYSVSKINQLVSFYIVVLWFVLLINTPKSWDMFSWSWRDIAVLVTTIVACAVLLCARTHPGPHVHNMDTRKSTINETTQS